MERTKEMEVLTEGRDEFPEEGSSGECFGIERVEERVF